MTQKSMAYDSPVYQAVLPIPLYGTSTLAGGANTPTMTGNVAQSSKYVAFTNMLIKSLNIVATTIGTSTAAPAAPLLYRVTNNGTNAISTVTATYTLSAFAILPTGTAAVSTSAYVINALPTTAISSSGASGNSLVLQNSAIPLLQGDSVYIAKGPDATEVVVPVLEAVIAPNANVTAP